VIGDAELRSMTSEERADLARRLAALVPPMGRRSRADTERARRRFVIVIGVASVLMIPWVIALAVSLPPRYLAGHWRLTWVGFDVMLGATLAITAWAALRRRQIMILSAIVSATLLVCDAWFDMMTASGHDWWASLATAVLVELPLAVWLFFVSHHLVRLSMRRLLTLAGQSPDVSLWRLPLLGVPPHRSRRRKG
jgi:integral membrane sensor domain MASE1